MPARERRCTGHAPVLAGIGEGQQGLHVRPARAGESHHQAIDDLLARQPDFRDQPPDGGMEPQRRANDFFGDVKRPVPAADVQQFMARDGRLAVPVQFAASARAATRTARGGRMWPGRLHRRKRKRRAAHRWSSRVARARRVTARASGRAAGGHADATGRWPARSAGPRCRRR